MSKNSALRIISPAQTPRLKTGSARNIAAFRIRAQRTATALAGVGSGVFPKMGRVHRAMLGTGYRATGARRDIYTNSFCITAASIRADATSSPVPPSTHFHHNRRRP